MQHTLSVYPYFSSKSNYNKMSKAELIFSVFASIALTMNLLIIPGGGILTLLSFSILSSLYFYLGFAIINGIHIRKAFKRESYKDISAGKIFGAIATGVVISMALVGIMFKVMFWAGGSLMMIVGLTGIFVITAIGIFKFAAAKSTHYTKLLSRLLVYGTITAFFFLIPANTLVDFKYRNHPEYAKAFKKFLSNPNNPVYREKLEEERVKMILNQ